MVGLFVFVAWDTGGWSHTTRERCALGLSRGTSPPSSVGVTLTSPEFGGGLLLLPQTDTAPRCPKYKNNIFLHIGLLKEGSQMDHSTASAASRFSSRSFSILS